MTHDTPTRTELRRGLVEQARKPHAVMRPLTDAELRTLRGEQPSDDMPRFGLDDTTD